MATRLLGKKLDGKLLGFMALAFAALFCAASVQVYRGERAQSEARQEMEEALKSLQGISTAAGKYQIVHFAAHGMFSAEDMNYRSSRLTNDYNATLLILAHEFGHIARKRSSILFYCGHSNTLTIEAHLDGSLDDYFYERLLLEKRQQEGHLSTSDYREEQNRLLQAYASRLPKSEIPSDEESLRVQLRIAEQQIIQMQAQVDSLKDQLARAERSTSEKWSLVFVAILSVLIALSANVIAWRTDRRQIREAELVPLKRQELEKNIIQKDQQIRESTGRIITPSPQEVQLYSRAMPVDKFERGMRSKT